MAEFINHQASGAFIKSIHDPIVRDMVLLSYQVLCMSDKNVEGEFDLLFFAQIMEEFLRDRELVVKRLRGEWGENKSGLGL